MRRSWRSHLFNLLAIGLFAVGSVDAATMVEITACTGCHTNNPQANIAPAESAVRNSPAGAIIGSHEIHVPSPVTTCAACHGTLPTAMNHRDGYIDFAATINGGSYSLGTHVKQDNQLTTAGLGNCANTTCHGNASPIWGVNTSDATCVKCHGVSGTTPAQFTADTKTAAPGYNGGHDTGNATAATDQEVGAHGVHLSGTSNYMNPIACQVCHLKLRTGYTNFTGHMDGTGTLTFSGAAVLNSATPSYSPNTCTATYCHGANLTNGDVSGSARNPVWNNSSLMSGTPGADCGTCHGNPPASVSGSHSGKTPTYGCNPCHTSVVDVNGNIIDKALHINGNVESTQHSAPLFATTAGHTGCASGIGCHLNVSVTPAYSWTGSAPDCRACHVKADPTVATNNCGSCHGATGAGATGEPNGTVHPDAVGSHPKHTALTAASCAGCHGIGGTGTNANHGQSKTATNIVNMTAGQTWVAGSATCTTSYCHSNGQSATGTATLTYSVAPPAWGTGNTNCGSCHKNMDSDATAPGTHVKHAQTYPISCATCHNPYSETTAIASTHTNGSIELSFSGTAAGTVYSQGNSAVGNGFGNCSVSYCHSNGRAAGMGTKQYSSARWGGGENCLGCHGGRDASGNAARSVGKFTLSTTHSQHLNKYSASVMNCQLCHYKTAASAIALKQYTGVQRHVNGTVDVVFGNLAYGSYTSYKSTKNCTNTSCHGGKTRNVWSASAQNTNHQCTHCHGVGTGVSATLAINGTNRYNLRYFAPGWNKSGTSTDQTASSNDKRVGSHFKHLSSAYMKNVKCNECHYVPTNPIEIGTNHDLNKLRFNSGTLAFAQSSSAMWNGVTMTKLTVFSGYTNGTATKAATCSSTYCHGSRLKFGDTAGTYRKPYWNYSAMINYTNPTQACARCHGNPPASVSASHSGKTATSSCVSCHPGTVNAAGKIIDKSKHINGIVEASSHDWPYPGATHSSAAGTYSAGYGNCNGCHTVTTGGTYPPASRNNATLVICTTCHINSANFNSASANCSSCHGNDATGRPALNAAIGNVFPNISGSHGKHVVGSGMSCNACHGPFGSGSLTHGSYSGIAHTNANKSTFVNVTSTTKQFHFTWAGGTGKGTCSTNSCHPSAEWGVTKLGCNGCHAYDTTGGGTTWLPALSIAGGSGAGLHVKHINFIKTRLSIATLTPTGRTFGLGEPAAVCGTCHSNTTGDHTMTSIGTRAITFGTGATANTMGAGYGGSMSLLFGSTAPSFNGTAHSCSNLICHYSTTPSWY